MVKKSIRYGVVLTTCLALFVVMLGAYTRLTHAGLGCPDWPGCYGHWVVPESISEQAQAVGALEPRKAWTEMLHRYAAGTLASLIVVWVVVLLRGRYQGIRVRLGVLLLMLLGFQAALGMWTVTLKLLPIVVMGHLLGGLGIFSCLVALSWQVSGVSRVSASCLHRWVVLGVVLVFCQIALGGMVSANDAGIACIGFPRCNGSMWPMAHWPQALSLHRLFRLHDLDPAAKIALQWVHRLGAMVIAAYVFMLSFWIIVKTRSTCLRAVAGLTVVLLLGQFTLGMVNVVYLLPLWAAVAHNGGAALLLGALISLAYLTHGASYANAD